MAAWSLLLPVLKRTMPLRRLVALMWTDASPGRGDGERAIIAMSERIARLRPRLRANCLDRSLIVYRFLARAGADPRLVLGIGLDRGMLVGHAWVTLNGQPVHESREAVAKFAPVVEFGSQGEAADVDPERSLPRVWR